MARSVSALELSLFSPSPSVYANGRQQALLRVRLEVKDGSAVVSPTDEEKNRSASC